jgi:drug/metabolite transporter (DMT)-like permease
MLFFYTISLLPLATAVTLNYTSPLFLASFLTLILRERFHRVMIFTLIIGFLGVILLLQPTLGKDQLLGVVLGLLSGILAGFAHLNIKQLVGLGEPEWRVVFYFSLISTLGAGVWMLVHRFHPITFENFWILLGLGACATLAQLALTRAYHTGKTLIVGNLAYTTVVFASLLGVIIWNEILHPISWVGIALIILSGILSMRVNLREGATKLV